MDKRHIIKLQGREFVTYEGLLDAAHRQGLREIRTTLVQIPGPQTDHTAICMAEVTLEQDGEIRVFTGIGDASPRNVSRNVALHLIRMAETRQAIIDHLIRALTLHAELEETIFYPAFERKAHDVEVVLEAYEEHHVMKFAIRELQAIDLDHPRLAARVKVLEELVSHHVGEEEREMMPRARRALGAERLKELGEEMLKVRDRCLASGFGAEPRVTVVESYEIEQPENI